MLRKFALTALSSLIVLGNLYADTDTAEVTWTINDVNIIDLSGNPAAFIINAPTSAGTSVQTDTTTTYAITTNKDNMKVSASINQLMPAGQQLAMQLGAPTGATAVPYANLSTTSVDLVTGITSLYESGLQVAYRLTVDIAAAQEGTYTRTVTVTLAPGA